MEIITSKNNEKIKGLRKLENKKERELLKQCLVEGEHLVEECYREGLIEYLILEEHQVNPYPELAVLWVSEGVAKSLSTTHSGSSCFALVHLQEKPIKKMKRVLICDDVQDPGNLGTMIRTALSFGFDVVYCSEGCADFYHDRTIRASQGAIFQIPLRRQNLQEAIASIKHEGLLVLGTDVHKGLPLEQYSPQPVALVLGSEGQGVSQSVLDLCDGHVRIEMSRFESLNVAVATGILCYVFREEM